MVTFIPFNTTKDLISKSTMMQILFDILDKTNRLHFDIYHTNPSDRQPIPLALLSAINDLLK